MVRTYKPKLMAIAQIKICYQQYINAESKSAFERDVFDYSYNAFLTIAPVYNTDDKLGTFSQILAQSGDGKRLQEKISRSVERLFENLNGIIPDLKDTLGNKIPYQTKTVKLLESNLYDYAMHRLVISYTSAHLILHRVIGNCLLLSLPKQADSCVEEASTFMLQLQPNLGISAYQEYQNKMADDFTGFAAN